MGKSLTILEGKNDNAGETQLAECDRERQLRVVDGQLVAEQEATRANHESNRVAEPPGLWLS